MQDAGLGIKKIGDKWRLEIRDWKTASSNEFENYFDKSEESVTVERRYKTILVWLRNFVNLNRGFESIWTKMIDSLYNNSNNIKHQ